MYNNPKIELLKQQPEDSSMLYRYVTIDKLLDFLLCNRIPLVRLNIFEDKLEGVSVYRLLLNYTSDRMALESENWIGGLINHVGSNINFGKRKSLKEQDEIFQRTNYASCWYIEDHESVAMWQLYSKSDSVAIRIPYKYLTDEILKCNFELPENNYEKIRIGSVTYYRYNNLNDIQEIILKQDIQGFAKDLSFQHEKEFRIILQTCLAEESKVEGKRIGLKKRDEKISKINNYKVLHLTLSRFRDLPFEIIFHPQTSDWHKDNIRKIISKFDLPFKTLESELKRIFG